MVPGRARASAIWAGVLLGAARSVADGLRGEAARHDSLFVPGAGQPAGALRPNAGGHRVEEAHRLGPDGGSLLARQGSITPRRVSKPAADPVEAPRFSEV
eukprot:4278512-Alexandrium_andersonii.AAC.1